MYILSFTLEKSPENQALYQKMRNNLPPEFEITCERQLYRTITENYRRTPENPAVIEGRQTFHTYTNFFLIEWVNLINGDVGYSHMVEKTFDFDSIPYVTYQYEAPITQQEYTNDLAPFAHKTHVQMTELHLFNKRVNLKAKLIYNHRIGSLSLKYYCLNLQKWIEMSKENLNLFDIFGKERVDLRRKIKITDPDAEIKLEKIRLKREKRKKEWEAGKDLRRYVRGRAKREFKKYKEAFEKNGENPFNIKEKNIRIPIILPKQKVSKVMPRKKDVAENTKKIPAVQQKESQIAQKNINGGGLYQIGSMNLNPVPKKKSNSEEDD